MRRHVERYWAAQQIKWLSASRTKALGCPQAHIQQAELPKFAADFKSAVT
jgi:hypothetical protein